MANIDTLETVYKLTDHYSGPALRVVASTTRMGSVVGQLTSAITGPAGLVAALGAAGIGLGVLAFNAAADFDALEKGLAASTKELGPLSDQIARLKEVAKLPGIGFEEALRGSTNLQAAGLSAAGAERALRAFSNAVAAAGRGKESLDLVNLALTQIATKSRVSGQEVRQLQEQLPQIREAIKNLFGTTDLEQLENLGISPQRFIEGLIKEFEKLKPVGQTIRSQVDNMHDAWKRALATIGKALATVIVPKIEQFSNWLERIQTSGDLSKWADKASNALDYLVKHFDDIVNVIEKIAMIWAGIWVVSVITQVITALMSVARIMAIIAGSAILYRAAMNPLAATLAIVAAAGVAAWINQMIRQAGGQRIGPRTEAGIGGIGGILGGANLPGNETNPAHEMGPRPPAATDMNAAIFTNPDTGPQIAKNTERTALAVEKQLDFSKYAFGGGNLAQMGITPVEAVRRGRSIQVNFQHAGNVERAISEMMSQAVTEIQRQGGF